MSTTPEETALLRLRSAIERIDGNRRRAELHVLTDNLASELAETKAKLVRTQTDLAFELRTIGMQARDWQQRAEAAESRLGEVGEAVQWFLTGEGIGMRFGGDMGTPTGLLDGLIAAWRSGK